mgnify:CR=1 FL=1
MSLAVRVVWPESVRPLFTDLDLARFERSADDNSHRAVILGRDLYVSLFDAGLLGQHDAQMIDPEANR